MIHVALLIVILPCAQLTAAQPKKIPRIGWLSVGHRPKVSPPFRQAMRQLGWFHGQNIEIVARFAKEKYDEVPKLARELVQLKVDLIVTADSEVIPAAKNATKTIPIVMTATGDPVKLGYVTSLARPTGNITGLSTNHEILNGKRLEILKEVVRTVSCVAIFEPAGRVDWAVMEKVSRGLRIRLQPFTFNHPHELERIFKATALGGANGLMVIAGPQTNHHRNQFIDFASRNRLPAVYPLPIYTIDGGLMSYGPDLRVIHRRAAYYVDKILKGARPSELPVERPMAAEFAINLRAAKEIGLTIPPEVLQRADKVIK